MTVARWRTQNWRSLQHEPRHPLEIARDRLDDAVPVLTGDPISTAASMVQGSADRRHGTPTGRPQSHSTQDRDDLVPIAGHGAHRNGPQALIAGQVIMRRRDLGGEIETTYALSRAARQSDAIRLHHPPADGTI